MKVLLAVLVAARLYASEVEIRGFPRESLDAEMSWEGKARGAIDPQHIREYLARIAAKPHHAGSAGSKAVADYVAGLLRSWGIEVRVEEFGALLPTPAIRGVEMIEPRRLRLQLKESAVAEDKDTHAVNRLPTYNAFSAAGDVTAPLVYVNYGLPEDYEYLRTQGVDVKGKIVIARYGAAWRGVKPKVAYERGAVGCLLYSDPRDDGYFLGDTFPRGPFRPSDGVQRGSVLDMTYYPGDPLTPGWAAEKGARRLPLAEAQTLQKIPVLPLSSGDARPLLRALRGGIAPEVWRGALPLTYHLGPGPAKVRMHVEFDWDTRPIFDVIGEMRGSRFPNEWVIYGNHHDAWVNGASDPSSGVAALLETARVLAGLRQQGWQPKRTLLFALWDAEEFGLIGSTEWTEKHAAEIERNVVAYVNSDANGKGRLHAGGSPILEDFTAEVARDVPDPATGKGLWQKDYRLSPLGSGSDYTPFLHHLGVASLSLEFSDPASRGCYHSVCDDLYWYEQFLDPNFVYERALSQLTATALIRLADAPIVPFSAGGVARAAAESLAELEKLDRRHRVNFAALHNELEKLNRAAASFEARYHRTLPKLGGIGAERLAAVNEKLFRMERTLAPEGGLPGRPWYRNRLFAPGVHSGYGAVMLPGIREAIDAQRWEEANRQAAELAEVLRNMGVQVREAERMLEGI